MGIYPIFLTAAVNLLLNKPKQPNSATMPPKSNAPAEVAPLEELEEELLEDELDELLELEEELDELLEDEVDDELLEEELEDELLEEELDDELLELLPVPSHMPALAESVNTPTGLIIESPALSVTLRLNDAIPQLLGVKIAVLPLMVTLPLVTSNTEYLGLEV